MCAAIAVLAAACTGGDGGGGSGEGAAADDPEPTAVVAEGDAPEGMWAGAVEGTDALVAVVASPERLVAYLCDSAQLSEWFSVDAPDAEAAATSSGGARLEVELTDEAATGSVTLPDGRSLAFTATPTDDSPLHRGVGQSVTSDVLAGWIDVGDTQRGAVNVTPRPGTTPISTVPTTGPSTTTTTAPTTTTTAPKSPVPAITATLPTRVVVAAPTLDTSKVVVAPPVTVAPTTTTKAPATTTTTAPPPKPPPSTVVFVPTTPDLPRVPVTVVPVTPARPGLVTPGRSLEYVVAGIGDSYASGEGAPVGPAVLDERFERIELPDWGEQFGDPACHRSDDAGFPVAVRDLQEEYPGISIRVGFFACSGAELQHMTTDTYDGADSEIEPDPLEAPQLDQVTDFVGVGPTARFDALYMSIGGNNAGFAPVVSACIQGGMLRTLVDAVNAATGSDLPEVDLTFVADPPGEGFTARIDGVAGSTEVTLADQYRVLVNPACDVDPTIADQVQNGFPDSSRPEMAGLTRLDEGYAELDTAIETLPVPPNEVLISQYPDPSRPSTDLSDEACGGIRGEPDLIHLVDPGEGQWAIDEVLDPLNAAVTAGATTEGWTLVDDHVDEFRQGHGICAGDDAWINSHNAALATQGDDMENEGLREIVAAVDEFLSDPVLPVIWTAIGGDPADLPTLDGLLNLSSGVMHPNRTGHRAYADAILTELEPRFVAAMTPEAPTNVRQTGGVVRGNVTIGWDDRSDVETRYEVRAQRVRGSGPATLRRTLGPDATRSTLALSGEAVYDVFVRACNPEFCSPEVQTRVSNVVPATPTGVAATLADNPLSGARELVVTWPDDPPDNEATFDVSLRQIDPAPTTAQPTVLTTRVGAIRVQLGTATFPRATYDVEVRACNAMGCSAFTAPVRSTSPASGVPSSTIEDLRRTTREQFPSETFIGRGVVIPDPPPPGPGPGPGPGPDPAPPGG